jgi:hypothetical protein
MVVSADFDNPLMVSAGRLGRAKDAFDKRDVARRSQAVRALRDAGLPDLALARGVMQVIVAEVHAAPEHLASKLYPLAMLASVTFAKIESSRAALYGAIDKSRAA